jgi:hypothetical protein
VVNTWRIVAAALVIFAAGVLTGGAGAGLASRFNRERRYPAAPRIGTNSVPRPANNAFRAPGASRLELLQRMTRDLDLSEEQRLKLDLVVSQGQIRLNELWEPVAPKSKATYDEIRKQLYAVLTQEQRQRLDAALKRRTMPRNVPATNAPAQ